VLSDGRKIIDQYIGMDAEENSYDICRICGFHGGAGVISSTMKM
jgi:hypothetical protein